MGATEERQHKARTQVKPAWRAFLGLEIKNEIHSVLAFLNNRNQFYIYKKTIKCRISYYFCSVFLLDNCINFTYNVYLFLNKSYNEVEIRTILS